MTRRDRFSVSSAMREVPASWRRALGLATLLLVGVACETSDSTDLLQGFARADAGQPGGGAEGGPDSGSGPTPADANGQPPMSGGSSEGAEPEGGSLDPGMQEPGSSSSSPSSGTEEPDQSAESADAGASAPEVCLPLACERLGGDEATAASTVAEDFLAALSADCRTAGVDVLLAAASAPEPAPIVADFTLALLGCPGASSSVEGLFGLFGGDQPIPLSEQDVENVVDHYLDELGAAVMLSQCERSQLRQQLLDSVTLTTAFLSLSSC